MQPELNQELSLLRKQVWGGGNSRRSSRVALLLHMAADRHAHVALSLARARLAECMFLRDSMTVSRKHYISDFRISQRGIKIKSTVNQMGPIATASASPSPLRFP
jgi:hypothetical protein